jgi:mutator protein MutT
MQSIAVAAAVIERDARILITRRLPGTHLAGLWEFPGGKPELGETLEDALRREMREELDADVDVGECIETVECEYPDRLVRIAFFSCALRGEPRPLEGQAIAWVSRDELADYEFPPADAALLARLRRG